MRNIQQRLIDAPAEAIGALLDRLGGPSDVLWPADRWPALVLDNGLAVGSSGGHGPIRYSVTEHASGHRIRLLFDPSIGVHGFHEFLVTDEGNDRSRLTHTLDARLSGRMLLYWPVAIRWLHDALLQDLLDNAERTTTGALSSPAARWSWWVRTLRRVLG